MKMLVDASALIPVALGEPERPRVQKLTRGAQLAAPKVLPYEIGNAVTGMMRRGRLSLSEALAVYDAVAKAKLELIPVDVRAAIRIASRAGICAYDAYYVECALRNRLPLLTLDAAMQRAAIQMHVALVEGSI